MSYHEEDEVARVMRAVRTAYDALQALRESRHSNIPPSLSDAEKAMDKLSGRLSVLNNSPEALSIFREYTVKEASNSVGTSLSDAIVHDMEAMATYFKAMKPEGFTGDLDEHRCRSIRTIVDSCIMLTHGRLRSNMLSARGHEIQDTVEGMIRRQAGQQDAEFADLRASE
jgi:hypothetical protein